MDKSILKDKSYNFAARIVSMTRHLHAKKTEPVLNKQALKSDAAIGEPVREAEFGQSMANFVGIKSVALKEADEPDYWLSILHDSDFLEEKLYHSQESDCKKIIAILVSTVKTAKKRKRREKSVKRPLRDILLGTVTITDSITNM